MNARLIYATLAGTVACFLLGWLIYGIALEGYFNTHMVHYEGLTKTMPLMIPLILSNLSFALMMALIFQRWAGFTTFLKGLTGGIILGFFVSFSYDMSFLSMFNLYQGPVFIVDILAAVVMYGLAGGVIGWVLGTGKKAA
jgi:hypothetical protein